MRNRRVLPFIMSCLLLTLMLASGPSQAGAGGRPPKSDAYRASLARLNARLRTSVDLAGRPASSLAPVIEILKNFLARKILKLPNDFRQAAVRHIHFVVLAALASEAEPKLGAVHVDVAVSERGQAI